MKLTLKREMSSEDGIFSSLKDEKGNTFATLEHAYKQADGSYAPKVKPGVYQCKRGPHRLHGMTKDFETFEVMGVKGHTGILFHVGNYNKDSDGCILVGAMRMGTPDDSWIVRSKVSFNEFMSLLAGIDSFELDVVG